MKVAMSMNVMKKPWGGGNQFGLAMKDFFDKSKYEKDKLIFNLSEDDIDIILLTDPRTSLKSNSFGLNDIFQYLNKKPDTLIIQRINECDQRKNTKYVNKQLHLANTIVDHTIFIASWLVEIFNVDDYSIILNGADSNIFKKYNETKIDSKKVKLVTHHWGASFLKGWDIYLELDRLISAGHLKNFEFHYIGNKPKNIKTNSIIYHDPCHGEKLARELSSKDIYITGSIFEPGGMHHIEGALCQLPIIFRNSGSLPEYCSGFGEIFDSKNDLIEAIYKVVNNYSYYENKLKNYKNTSSRMCEEYYNVFEKLLSNKKNILKNRNFNFMSSFEKLKINTQLFYYGKLLGKLGYV